MNGYEVSLRNCSSVCCVCLVICNLIQSSLPNYITTNEGTYVLLKLKIYCYNINICDVRIQAKLSIKQQAPPPDFSANHKSPFLSPKL